MTVRTHPHALPDTYFELVRRFPLTRIRDGRHLRQAMALLDELTARDLDAGQGAYLDVLTDLVEAYEREHTEFPAASERDVLRELMSANRLTQARLSRLTGIAQSTISEVLNGRRSLTKAQITTLARHFGIRPTAFLPV
jgi:HTH-type transcriptional regulator/antitoxin HigA